MTFLARILAASSRRTEGGMIPLSTGRHSVGVDFTQPVTILVAEFNLVSSFFTCVL